MRKKKPKNAFDIPIGQIHPILSDDLDTRLGFFIDGFVKEIGCKNGSTALYWHMRAILADHAASGTEQAND